MVYSQKNIYFAFQMSNLKYLKRIFKGVGIALAIPVLLIIFFAVLLYFPPVQTFIKDKTTAYLSKETGTEISIDNIRLGFPLDLSLNGTKAMLKSDTLLSAKNIRLDVRLLPLFQGKVALDKVLLSEANLNSMDFISDMQVKGHVGTFEIEVPVEYNLREKLLELGTVKLYDSNVAILLSDTAKEDTTTEEPTEMIILLHKADIQKSGIFLQMPGDSMRIDASIGKGLVNEVSADLGKNYYRIKDLQLDASAVKYDIPYENHLTDRLDYNHIDITDLYAKANQIDYTNGNLQANIAKLSFKDTCGLQVDNLTGNITYNNNRLVIPDLTLKTPQTELKANAKIDMDALEPGKNGKMDIKLEGQIGRKDLEYIAGDVLKDNKDLYPDEPLNIKAHITGNVDNARVHEMEAKLGNVAHFNATGNIRNLLSDQRDVDLDYNIKAGNMAPLRNLIPSSVHIPANMVINGKFKMLGESLMTDAKLHSGKGWLHVEGQINQNTNAYDLTLRANKFPLKTYLPQMPLSPLTAVSHLKGRGFDFKDKGTILNSKTNIQYLSYDNIPLDSIKLDAHINNCRLLGKLVSENRMLTATTNFNADILRNDIKAKLQGHVDDLSMLYLTNGADSSHIMMKLQAEGLSTYDGSRMGIKGVIEDLNIITPTTGFPTDSVIFRLGTSNDSTFAAIRSGDFMTRFFSPTSIDAISQSFNQLLEHIKQQIDTARIDQMALRHHLPTMELYVKSGNYNPIAQILYHHGYSFNKFDLSLKTVQDEGIDGKMTLKDFRTGDLILDKTTAILTQDTTNLKLACAISNTSKKNPNRFTAKIDGELLENGFSLASVFKDSKKKEGLNLGLRGELSPEHDITMHLFPETSVIAYRKFKVNKDNFFTITPDNIILANVDLLADDQTGLKVNATKEDSINDVSISLSKVNIDELCGVLPYLPKMGGFLSGDFHVIRQDSTYMASGTMEMENFQYETYNMGDFGTELVFLPQDSTNYDINAIFLNENIEVADFDGTYSNVGDGVLDAVINLQKFPGKFLNAFLPSDGTLELEGCLEGNVAITGQTSALDFNGEILPDSLQIISPLYGVNLNVVDKPLSIKNSCIFLDSIMMYSAKNKNPLTINGNVNFSDLDKITMDIDVKAKDFQIVDSEKTKTSLLYGQVYSDIDAKIKGSTNFMFVKGNLHILGKTNMTYIMKEGPLAVDDWLNGLVEFQDFNDSTASEKEIVETSKMLMVMNIKIDETSKIRCELSADGNSFFNCNGGGNLTMKYLPSGDMTMTGQFNLKKGQMKYELPFIPLKTFNLTGENYITFTGKPFNPTLNIKAMETTRASVNDGSSATRMVTFNVGVAITQTLENMGLQFLIEAPSDMNVQNDLASMSAEEKGKVAVTMLATGMYASSSNKSSFKANNALNAFLQSEIQNLAGNALKTLDLTVGMEGSTSASGNAQTDYSFQFAKHLWNDKVTIVIGGKVSAGAEDASNNQSFIDNISLEYRLDKNASRNLRLFYNNDTQDPLEGNLSTAGAGFVLRSKTNSLGELFLKPRKKTNDGTTH